MSNTIDILDELSNNFLVSSLDTNIGRAFPDVRDGLKPGMRTILWEMYSNKYLSSKPHVKSAKISGGVIAKWWPHSDVAIYDTFARMSQGFTNNIPEVDFHGNNGNIILGGDAVANQRYTEARLSSVVEEGMFNGINKENVDMILNFSEDAYMPKVLPAVFPRLLVNGSQGIGVSIANVWLPHSFTETAKLIANYLKEGVLDEDNYFPDFPTGGTIINKSDLAEINKTGRGKVILEASYNINGKEIDFYEMPYQVYIEPVIEQIEDAINKEKLTGIKHVYNKSDKNKISLVIECSLDPENVVNQLFECTDLRKQFNANQNGIVSKTPVLLNLKEVIDVYIAHNIECIKREHQYDYNKAAERLNIVLGLLKALSNIDEIIEIIRVDENPRETMMITFGFDDKQAQAILDMKLARLSRLETEKLEEEKDSLVKRMAECDIIINSEKQQKILLTDRLLTLAEKYGDKRRTNIIQKTVEKKKNISAKKAADRPVEDVIVVINKDGYIKSIPIKNYRASKTNLINVKTNTEDVVNIFTNKGKMFRISIRNIKQCASADKGTAIGSLVNLENNEKVIFANFNNVPYKEDYIVFLTKNGNIKKSAIEEYYGEVQNLRGTKAVSLKDNDEVISIQLGNNYDDFSIITSLGYGISFESGEVSYQGKNASGVKAIGLKENDYCENLTVGQALYPTQKRGGKGKIVVKK